MAINGVPAKTDYELFNDTDFIVDGKVEPKYYREVPAKKVNKAFNLVKSDPTKQIKKESRLNKNRRNRRLNKESVMTPIPSYRRDITKREYPDTATGNANVLVNEIAKLLDKHIDNYDVDFEVKIKCDEDETKWMTVNYDVIKVLADIIKDYID